MVTDSLTVTVGGARVLVSYSRIRIFLENTEKKLHNRSHCIKHLVLKRLNLTPTIVIFEILFVEEREEEYEKAKRRIFNDMNKEQKSQQQQPHQSSDQRLGCLASTKGGNQARSFDIRESLTGPADRPAVSKSFSFGG